MVVLETLCCAEEVPGHSAGPALDRMWRRVASVVLEAMPGVRTIRDGTAIAYRPMMYRSGSEPDRARTAWQHPAVAPNANLVV